MTRVCVTVIGVMVPGINYSMPCTVPVAVCVARYATVCEGVSIKEKSIMQRIINSTEYEDSY